MEGQRPSQQRSEGRKIRETGDRKGVKISDGIRVVVLKLSLLKGDPSAPCNGFLLMMSLWAIVLTLFLVLTRAQRIS